MTFARAALAAAGLTALALGGCSESASSLPWRIELASAEARELSVHVEATIRQGGCSGEEIYRVVVRRGEAIEGMKPPELEPGRYGFAARSRDADCAWIARGCQNVELPTDDTVVVTLTDIPPAPACQPAQCMDGRCLGEMDGGMDAGLDDASTRMDADMDAETDAARDTGTGDAGPDAGDAGAPDAGDAGPDAGPCDGACTECEQCEAGSCVPVDDGTNCGTDMVTAGQCYGGECCTGCWDGTRCEPGNREDECGNFGTSCSTCNFDERCCDFGDCIDDDFACP